ncbi:stress-activated map kinase-interacting protein 1 [Coprinopsis sp. MPI-PUGE-AT-0042]|nr:stress-activated map kinase-interacting protein 1 [Coprinopsis sp. MPI-PUGE-AT-0042]
MSLISDTDYLIHRIRLGYLRDSEDPYASRIVGLDPLHPWNRYIVTGGLGDRDRWPELDMPQSPEVSDDEDEKEPSGFPRSKLRYTQTIMGGRSGALGMRAKNPEEDVSNFVKHGAPVQALETLSTSAPAAGASKSLAREGSWEQIVADGGEGTALSPGPNVKIQVPTAPEEAPVTNVVRFVPKFTAETEARRRYASSDYGEEVGGGIDSMDEGDEFDPATRTDVASDSDVIQSRIRGPRLAPVLEHRRHGSRNRTANLTLEGTTVVNPVNTGLTLGGNTVVNTAKSENDVLVHKKSSSANMSRSKSDNTSGCCSITEGMFARKTSSMIADASGSSNPFGELYAAISGRGQSSTANCKPMELQVRKDASVEEVIGFALWSYWEEGWLPKLDDGLEILLSAVGWILRIAEDDGEVDDDFPPPDRMGKITKFNSDAYAVLHASTTQIQQNQVLESKIQRRPSRTMASKKVEKPSAPSLLTAPAASTSFLGSEIGGSFALSTSLGPSFTHGPQIFLRVRVAGNADTVHISTTIPVSAGMYMQEALEMVCRKRKLDSPKDYALLLRLPDATIMIPLDRTVASLQGNRELLLVKRTMLNSLGFNISKEIKTTDPNASILKGMETPEQHFSSTALDYTQAYKEYTVYRKLPMMVTRQERTLAIDGQYIHVCVFP